jgi:hypothetical protein
MKRRSILISICFVAMALVPASRVASQLQKVPDHIYICTFNVYKLGSVDHKYTSFEEDGDEEGGSPTFSIPDRIKNLANVLAAGPFDLVVFQEVTDGERGQAAMTDLVKELQDKYSLDYKFFMSDYIGQGLMAEAMAFMYDPKVIKPQLLPGKTSLVQNIEIPGRDLVRTQWKAGDFDFTLISVHLAWGNEADRDAGYAKVNEIFWTDTPSQYSDDPDIIVGLTRGPVMHEFGHNLNLHHGGDDDDNFKPNYHSVMNYHWQTPHWNHVGWVLDYSRDALPTLDESNLDESAGIGGDAGATVPVGPLPVVVVSESGPIDWNGDGDTQDTGLSADINYVRTSDPGGPSPGQVLTGHNDWPVLWYRLSGHANFQDGVHDETTIPEEMTYEVYRELYEYLPLNNRHRPEPHAESGVSEQELHALCGGSG